jgi:hypothetical protein
MEVGVNTDMFLLRSGLHDATSKLADIEIDLDVVELDRIGERANDVQAILKQIELLKSGIGKLLETTAE